MSLEDWLLRSWVEDSVVLPAFPLVASRLVDCLEQPDADVDRVEEIIGQDASITAQVIRAANSALYASAVPIESLRQALMRLGFRETAGVAMAAACRTLFEMEDRAELEVFPDVWERLWESALGGAYTGRLLANELKLGDPGRVFLAAMFRDVGSLLVLKLLASGLVNGRLRHPPSEIDLQRAFAMLHERLGAEYLRRSEMPEALVKVVEDHHAELLPFQHDTVELHLVRLADALCEQLEISPFACGALGLGGQQSAEVLGVDSERLEYFALQLEAVREQIRGLL